MGLDQGSARERAAWKVSNEELQKNLETAKSALEESQKVELQARRVCSNWKRTRGILVHHAAHLGRGAHEGGKPLKHEQARNFNPGSWISN
jgi:hypothetical protein